MVGLGIGDDDTVLCHTLLALEHAGFAPGRLYAGSWSQYSAVADRPVATGDRGVRWAVRAVPQ